jgi:hypothetical protein
LLRSRNRVALDRRRFLTGAVASASALAPFASHAQDAAPTPVTIRIQTPDLAFVDALQRQLTHYQSTNDADALLFSIVPAEPAADSLLNDLRLNGRRFAGAFVPYWLIPDLVRDGFIEPATPPPVPLPPAIAALRSFGGEWFATDCDHDCDLLYTRIDLLEQTGAAQPETWDQLREVLESTGLRIALPRTHSARVVDHFAAMAASYAGEDPFWFDPETMEPAIASLAHQTALEAWNDLQTFAVDATSTGDLWQSFVNGDAAFLIASADAYSYFQLANLDSGVMAINRLPGYRLEDGDTRYAGNVVGTNWGGVTLTGRDGAGAAAGFFDDLALPDVQTSLWTDLQTGINPAIVDPEEALESALTAGWPEKPTDQWVEAISETMNDALQLVPLRIAETQRYLQALEARLIAFLTGSIPTSAEALELAAEDWRAINQAIDVDIQRELFARSLMPTPIASAPPKQ